MYNYTIPYAVCDFNTDGKLKNIKEKPNYNFFVNTGLYVIEPKVLELLPSNVKFDMDELLEKARKKGMNIGAYPITQNSWIDFGVWSEYKKNVKRFS
jgi:NDP-sugar pyrophosphorylase family protein